MVKKEGEKMTWFLPDLTRQDRTDTNEFLTDLVTWQLQQNQNLEDGEEEGYPKILQLAASYFGFDFCWLVLNGSKQLRGFSSDGKTEVDLLLEDCRRGILPPCFDESRQTTTVILPQNRPFCRDCPVGQQNGSCCMVSGIYSGGVWKGVLGARIARHLATDPIRQTLLSYLAGVIGANVYRNVLERERQLLREQLASSQRLEALGKLAAGVAHDFNNLLTVIMACCGFAREQCPKAAEDLDTIQQSAKSASELTRQLLAFGRRQILQPQHLDLCGQVKNLEKLLRRLLGEHIKLTTSFPAEELFVLIDPVQLEQIVINLSINARDAMPKGGELNIACSRVEIDEVYAARHLGVLPGRYVLLAVSDTGQGMDEKTMSHIFEPFYSTKGDRGTGLGLSVVFGIVRQSGGFIWVYSEPGQGTTFKIYLPLVGPAEDGISRGAVPARPPSREQILLIEDNAQVRNLTRRMLEKAGYRAEAVANAQQALEASARLKRVEVIISEVVLPDASGSQLVAQLHQIFPGVPILFTSGYSDETVVRMGVEGGDDSFLQKPYSAEALLDRIGKLLAGK